jgi:hypothetical protein
MNYTFFFEFEFLIVCHAESVSLLNLFAGSFAESLSVRQRGKGLLRSKFIVVVSKDCK